jgi:DNA-binding CsgD family transcriptional regulator
MVKTKRQADILTIREFEILKLISKGYRTREISNLLSINFETIKSHRKNIIHKFEAKNIVEALFRAIQLGKINLFD